LSNEIKVLNDAYNQYVSTNAEIEKSSSVYEKYRIIAEATSSTKGKPVITIRDTVEHALTLTNRLLNIMYDGEIELLEPTIDESSFSLPFRSGSHTSPDIKYGSQSENTLLSLALELSLSSSLTHYDVPLIDELDAYLDDVTHESFLLMIQEMMATLKIEQLFLISHNIQPGQYDHIVHVVDISKK
jgi:DNA repair exonuclease SbcCD ATPase subunit